MEVKEKMKEYIESELGQDVITILAYTIKKSETTKDDEIVSNSAEISEVIAEALSKVDTLNPTDEEVKNAIVGVLEKVVKETSTKWDDRALKVLKMFI
jgi:hypothetical protein